MCIFRIQFCFLFLKSTAYILLIFTFFFKHKILSFDQIEMANKNQRECKGTWRPPGPTRKQTEDPLCSSPCCCAANEFLRLFKWCAAESVCACLGVQVQNQAPGKEVKGKGLYATERGNQLCVLSSLSTARSEGSCQTQPCPTGAWGCSSSSHAGKRYKGSEFFGPYSL